MGGTTNDFVTTTTTSSPRARGRRSATTGSSHSHHGQPKTTTMSSSRNQNATSVTTDRFHSMSNETSRAAASASSTTMPLHSSASYYTTTAPRTAVHHNQYGNYSNSNSGSNNAPHPNNGTFPTHRNQFQNSFSRNIAQNAALSSQGGSNVYRYPSHYNTTSSTTTINPIYGDYSNSGSSSSSMPQIEIVQRKLQQQLAAAHSYLEQQQRMYTNVASNSSSTARAGASSTNQRLHSGLEMCRNRTGSNAHETLRLSAMPVSNNNNNRSPLRAGRTNNTSLSHSSSPSRSSSFLPISNNRSPLRAGRTQTTSLSHSSSPSRSSLVPISSNANTSITVQTSTAHVSPHLRQGTFFSNNPNTIKFFQQAVSTTKKVNIKKEKALQKVQEESKPKTPQEADVLNQLRGMGFHDPPTILSAIRTVILKSENSSNDDEVIIVPTTQQIVDQTMVFLLSQKEELEEAALLDRARVSSEKDKEQTAQQAVTKENNLINCKSEEGQSFSSLKSYFHKSELLCQDDVSNLTCQIWTIPSTTCGTTNSSRSKLSSRTTSTTTATTNKNCIDLKRHFVEVLLLEQKAIKWYGDSQFYGSKSYFRHVLAPGIVKEAKVLFPQQAKASMKSSKGSSEKTISNSPKKSKKSSSSTSKRTRSKSRERTPRKRSSQSPPKNDECDDENHQKALLDKVDDCSPEQQSVSISSSSFTPVNEKLALTSKAVTSFLKYLKEQTEIIKRGLYSLEEQEGNMPKIFVKANRDAKKFGWWSTIDASEQNKGHQNQETSVKLKNHDEDDDDDIEIVEVQVPPSSKTNSDSNSDGSSFKGVEVIELD